MKTAIIYSPIYLDHKTGKDHPEKPQRLTAIIGGIIGEERLKDKIAFVEPKALDINELLLVHAKEYIEKVKHICDSGGGLINDETPLSRESFNVARLAAGGAVKAVEKVISGDFNNSFVLARPPGHHAGPKYGLGFCIFNNVALAAKYLIERKGLRRVLVLDIDAHHGNGTQDIFYDTNEVLYVSIHEDPSDFPKTGFIWEVGVEEGRGYTVNIPLPYGSGDPAFWRALKTIVLPISKQYKPQFILVSAGFDGYYKDPISDLLLSAHIYPRIFQEILNLASELCDGRLVAVLEGGYNLYFLRRAVRSCVARMAGVDLKIRDERPPINLKAQKEANKIIEVVRKVQSRYWSLDTFNIQ
ncbi:MAG: histone deacetylase [Candidatus Bathyarchaeota archaeon]|nr:histone deacetylase [Candidatus Bathyarchaeota archaeon]